MNAVFPLLGDDSYINYLGSMRHLGSNPSTHIAEIRYPVQKAPITSVVKIMDPYGPSAFNEAIAWLFLRAAGVPTPRNSALLILSEQKIVQILGRKLIEPRSILNGYVLAWSAQQLDYPSIRALFAGGAGSEKWLQMLKTASGTAIAAFDEVFLNLDRNLGNVLFYGKQSCVAIDHEQCFGQQNWISSDLQHLTGTSGDSLRVLQLAVRANKIDLKAFDDIKNHIVLHGQRHAGALAECSGHITDLLSRVFPDQAEELSSRVLSFITVRTADRWMETKLGVM